jgi:hypothetical protein
MKVLDISVACSHAIGTSRAKNFSASFIQLTIMSSGTLRTRAAARAAPPDLAFGQSLSTVSEQKRRMK